MMNPTALDLPCPRCGTLNAADAEYCRGCSIDLEFARARLPKKHNSIDTPSQIETTGTFDLDRTKDNSIEPTNQVETVGTSDLDPIKVQYFIQQLREKQSLLSALQGGIAAAVVAAAIWAIITAVTHYQIGWMAIGVGFLVGYAVRRFGQGIDKVFGISGAVLSLLGCVGGDILSVAIFTSQELSISIVEVLLGLLFSPDLWFELVREIFSPVTLLFYALAIYEGYKLSFRPLSATEVASLSAAQTPHPTFS